MHASGKPFCWVSRTVVWLCQVTGFRYLRPCCVILAVDRTASTVATIKPPSTRNQYCRQHTCVEAEVHFTAATRCQRGCQAEFKQITTALPPLHPRNVCAARPSVNEPYA